MIRSSVVLPQPDGPTIATISLSAKVSSILPSTGQSAAIRAERFALDPKAQNYVRHRIAQLSSGCMIIHSIICTTRIKASV